MSIKGDLRRVAARLRELEPCPECGITRADRRPTFLMNHPSMIAARNCPRCRGGLQMVFTLNIGHGWPELTPEQAEQAARGYAAEGMTPSEGWELRPQIMEAMARLGLC